MGNGKIQTELFLLKRAWTTIEPKSISQMLRITFNFYFAEHDNGMSGLR